MLRAREEEEEGEEEGLCYDAPMLREEEEGNRIKGLRKLECPNHLGGCYIAVFRIYLLTDSKSIQNEEIAQH
ncbi:hypothetical protein PN499_23605 [Kamptonema animale CS-326]|jgi:hypothetical protein|uniref:hypothetical protein n=1 Tax=Kamptonema animale TaxID=92934 RepID=UPI00232E91B8|nr:hypothetical protein [Kamptonema animale]MDB9514190.1 hypothetical protein [Kamptonema animale CS-326]